MINPKTYFIKNKPLYYLILTGLILRVIFALNSNHIFHPDEVFQSLEPAHRLAFGYGLIPWDFQYGLRSYLYPALLSLPLLILKLFHLDNPQIYIPTIKIILSLCSLILIPAGYYLSMFVTKNHKIAIFTAFCLTVWYELIYFSGRALTEIFASYLLALAVLLILKKPKLKLFLGYVVGVALITRIQYLLLLILLIPHRKKLYQSHLFGFALSIFTFGLVDVIAYHSLLAHLINNIQISFFSGLSTEFGIEPWYYYFKTFFVSSMGLGLLAFLKPNPKVKIIWISLIGLFLLHSFIPHKEYRFVFILIPIWLILFSLMFSKNLRFGYLLVSLVSMLGFLNLLPGQFFIYSQPLWLKDPLLEYEINLPKDQKKSVYIPDRDWVFSGSYYYLHQNIPIYSQDYPPVANQHYSYYRSFTYLKPYLKKFRTYDKNL
jgi:GPI mannosyltransferase 3